MDIKNCQLVLRGMETENCLCKVISSATGCKKQKEKKKKKRRKEEKRSLCRCVADLASMNTALVQQPTVDVLTKNMASRSPF